MQQRQLIEIDPQRIKFNPNNPRKHRGTELIRLRASIKAIGIVQLPTVRVLPGGFYEVIDGEGRVSIAQEEHFETIWVVSVGIIDEREAMMMLQSANTMRSFNFLAECKGLANLYRQKKTCSELAKQFGISPAKATTMVAVGHLTPQSLGAIEEQITQSEQRAEIWCYNLFDHLLPLRELLPGKNPAGGIQWSSLDDLYDYNEVNKAISMVMKGKITTADQMRIYAANRRYEIYQGRFDQDLERKLQEQIEQTQQDLEAVREQQVQEFKEKELTRYTSQMEVLNLQLEDLQTRHTKIINDVAKRPEIVAEREKELSIKIQEAEVERQRLQEERRAWEAEAQQKLASILDAAHQERIRNLEETKQQAAKELEERRVLHDQLYKKMEDDLKAYYEKKDEERTLKAANTIRGLLSFGIKSLAETQQTIDHIISDGMFQGVQQLGGSQYESLLWAVRSMQDALERAEGRMARHDTSKLVLVESEMTYNGQTSASRQDEGT